MNFNAAVFMLAGRKDILPNTLKLFYKNWNNYYKYPLYIYTLKKIYTKSEIRFYEQRFEGLKFIELNPFVPKNINSEDLFYKRTYNEYVKKKFDVRRLGFLHMCYFRSNITFFGEWGCKKKILYKYDYLMNIDDDSRFKKRIKFDLFNKLTKYPMATCHKSIERKKNLALVRENLLFFLKKYVKKYKIKAKNKTLNMILKTNDEKNLNKLAYSTGNLDLYSMKIFKSKHYRQFINEVNKFGGQYKYRWGDIEITNLFLYLYYEKPIYSYKLYPKFYEPSHPDAKPIHYKSNFFYLIYKIRSFFGLT